MSGNCLPKIHNLELKCPILGNLVAKLNFWTPITFCVGISSCPSEYCNFFSLPIFLAHDADDVTVTMSTALPTVSWWRTNNCLAKRWVNSVDNPQAINNVCSSTEIKVGSQFTIQFYRDAVKNVHTEGVHLPVKNCSKSPIPTSFTPFYCRFPFSFRILSVFSFFLFWGHFHKSS